MARMMHVTLAAAGVGLVAAIGIWWSSRQRYSAPAVGASGAACSSAIPISAEPVWPMVRTGGAEGVVLIEGTIPSGSRRFTPGRTDIARAESIMSAWLASPEPKGEHEAADLLAIVRDLPCYRRQYVGYIDGREHRMLWVNLFLQEGDQARQWTTRVISVRGGGRYFFNLVVDLDAGRAHGLSINSPR